MQAYKKCYYSPEPRKEENGKLLSEERLKFSLNITDGSQPKEMYLYTEMYTQRSVKCCEFP